MILNQYNNCNRVNVCYDMISLIMNPGSYSEPLIFIVPKSLTDDASVVDIVDQQNPN